MPFHALRRVVLPCLLVAASFLSRPRARADEGASIDGKPVTAWIDLLSRGDNHERELAMKALGKGGKTVVPPLVTLLKGADTTAGAWAAEALSIVGPEAVDAAEALAAGLLRDGMDWPCANALEALGAPGVPGLVAGLAGERQGTRMAALVSLEKVEAPIPVSALPALRKTAADPDAEVRGATAPCLARVAVTPEIRLAALAPLVADPDAGVRSQVVAAIVAAAGGEPGAVLPLALLSGDPDDTIRAAATTALAGVERGEGDKQVVENALARGLGDLDGDVRAAAVAAVVGMLNGDERLRRRVGALAVDTSPAVRAEVLRALGLWGRREAEIVAALVNGLGDADAVVRVAAAASLCRVDLERARALDLLFGEVGIYHGERRVRDAVVRACAAGLGAASDEARRRLEKIAADPAEEIAHAAKDALARLDEARDAASKTAPSK